MTAASCNLGTDVGGTFTDLAWCTPDGELHCLKVPSTPSRPGQSILVGVDELFATLAPAAAAWQSVHHTHSSTVATNALIERRVARVGLITTAGFRDVFELQRLAIPHPMRFDSRRPEPLIPRALVREVRGRIGPDGAELEPLDEADVVAAAQSLQDAGVEIAVVGLIHSYRNPAHEQQLRAIVQRHGLTLRLELSSEIWPQAREYERTVLTALNASIRPTVEAYLDRLTAGLAERGLALPPRVARSNGGAELATTLRERPVVALLSGPAAGVAGAAATAEDADWTAADLMTLDVGGTSADIGVIRGGRPVLSSEEQIGEFPVLVPTIAVSSIGAGGGSIIWLDPTGSLKVGPRSVGAEPGPACYGTGSSVPALTDAFLVAGLLEPGQRLGGKLALQMAPARAALDAIAKQIGNTTEEVADGAIRVATALMAAEASRVLARRGVDAPSFRMVAFGGAGPLMAALLADEIGIDAILIPPVPGALSALGAARADIEGDLVQPVYRRLHSLSVEALGQRFQLLTDAAQSWGSEQTQQLAVQDVRVEYAADMRYEGQGYDVTVALDAAWLQAADADAITAAFHAEHRAVYGHANEQAEVWMKELRAHVTGVMPKVRVIAAPDDVVGRPDTTRPIRLFGRIFEAAVRSRSSLVAGSTLAGPAIVNQMDTTTLIPPGWQARPVRSGALVLERMP
jgi:N-methylhydantoinase A